MTSVLDKQSLLVTRYGNSLCYQEQSLSTCSPSCPLSGDGSLCCVDLRQKKLEEKSDCSESELLCVAVVKVVLKWHNEGGPYMVVPVKHVHVYIGTLL